MNGRWIAVRPEADIDALILVRNDEERALINAGIDRYVAELEAGNECGPAS